MPVGPTRRYLISFIDLERDLSDAVADAAEQPHHAGTGQRRRARCSRQISLQFQEVHKTGISLEVGVCGNSVDEPSHRTKPLTTHCQGIQAESLQNERTQRVQSDVINHNVCCRLTSYLVRVTHRYMLESDVLDTRNLSMYAAYMLWSVLLPNSTLNRLQLNSFITACGNSEHSHSTNASIAIYTHTHTHTLRFIGHFFQVNLG